MFEYLQVRNALVVLIVRPTRYGTAVSKIDGALQGLKAVGLDRARGVRTDGDSSQRIRQPGRRRLRISDLTSTVRPTRTRLFASLLRSVGKSRGIRV